MGKKHLHSSLSHASLLKNPYLLDKEDDDEEVGLHEETSWTTSLSSSLSCSNDSSTSSFGSSRGDERDDDLILVPTMARQARKRRLLEYHHEQGAGDDNVLPWFVVEENETCYPEYPSSSWWNSWYTQGQRYWRTLRGGFATTTQFPFGSSQPFHDNNHHKKPIISHWIIATLWLWILLSVALVERCHPVDWVLPKDELLTYRQAQALVQSIQQQEEYPPQTLTLVTSSDQLYELTRAVEHYAACPIVQDIFVEYLNGDLPSRLWNHPKVTTTTTEMVKNHQAVFLVDPTRLLPCSQLARALAEWRRDPTRLVGFAPLLDEAKPRETSYSLLSDRVLILHPLLWQVLGRHHHKKKSIPLLECQEYLLAAQWASSSRLAPTAVSTTTSGTNNDPHSCHKQLLHATRQVSFPSNDLIMTSR